MGSPHFNGTDHNHGQHKSPNTVEGKDAHKRLGEVKRMSNESDAEHRKGDVRNDAAERKDYVASDKTTAKPDEKVASTAKK